MSRATSGGDDPFFGPPYIDEDVWDDVGVRHRYVHGGFEGTDTRFAFYFPEAPLYTGRFVQFLEGGQGGHEGKAHHPVEFVSSMVEMAASIGGYFVECNTGHIDVDPGPGDPTITAYRANAQSARYARQLAEEMYGTAPHHGYLVGGSGGGMRSLYAMEHVDDVWDGAVPFVCGPFTSYTVGTSMPLPRMVNAGATLALLRPESRATIIDALEPGGDDLFEGLDDFEREAVDALFKSGFPHKGLFQYAGQTIETMTAPQWVMIPLANDPGYLSAFWTVPGYAGADGELDDRVIDITTTVSEVRTVAELAAAGITDHPLALMGGLGCGLVSDEGWPTESAFATLTVQSGTAAGQELACWGTFGDVLVVSGGADLAPGDDVAIDNKRFLGAALYHRYQDQRERAGATVQSSPEVSPAGFLPTGMSGRFVGKMIMFDATLDAMAPPPNGVTWAQQVHGVYGDETDHKFRLWWVDNSCHTGRPMGLPGPPPALETRAVLYGGVIQEALRSVIEWVEDGVEPAPSTVYRFENGQIELPARAADRRGIQPVAAATVEGSRRVEVGVGTTVTFDVLADAPPQGGHIIDVAWDFDGSGEFACALAVDGTSATVRLATTHTFDKPGTYFPAVRVTSERNGTMDATLGRMENLDRVRVVVT